MSWEDALRSVMDTFRGQSPAYGAFDCCQFGIAYVRAVTGVDHSSKYTYHTAREALSLINEHDGIVGLVSSCMGDPHADPKPGELVAVHVDRFLTLGVLTNYGVVIGIHRDHGLARFSGAPVLAAWTV